MPSEDPALPPPLFMNSVASTTALIALVQHGSVEFSRTELHVGTTVLANPGHKVLPTLERHHLVDVSGGHVRLAVANPFHDELCAVLRRLGEHYPVAISRHGRAQQIQRRAHLRRPIAELFGSGAASDELLMLAALGAASAPMLVRLGFGIERQVRGTLRRFRRIGILSVHLAHRSNYYHLNSDFVAGAELSGLLFVMLRKAKSEFLGTAAVVSGRDRRLRAILDLLRTPHS